MTAAGIYVHLPYCRSRCEYCSFVVSTDDRSRSSYLACLEREAALVAPEAAGFLFDTIYLPTTSRRKRSRAGHPPA